MSRSFRSMVSVRLFAILLLFSFAEIPASATCAASGTNPSTITFTSTSGSSAFGQPVTFTVNVADTSGGGVLGSPTGAVQFFADGNLIVSASLAPNGDNINSTASGIVSTLSFTAPNPHVITATYNGDATFTCSSIDDGMNGDGAHITQTITMGASTTSVATNQPVSQTLGMAVMFTATVSDADASGTAPTGTVLFRDGGVSIGSGALSAISTSQSTATFTTSVLTTGLHTMTAAYAGDTNFGGSNSSSITQTVLARTSNTAVPTTGSITVGSAATIAVTISDQNAGASSGTSTASVASLTARFGAAAAKLLDGTVLVAGGADGVTNISAFLYNGTSFTSTTGSLQSSRVFATATLLQDGTVLIVGGSTDGTASAPANVTNDAAAEIYNPGTKSFTTITGAILGTPRFGHTATLLSDGKVLIAGGEDQNGGALQSTELYDPGTQTFSPGTPTLLQARFQHTATLLPNGLILMAGGDGAGDAELLNPTAVVSPFAVATGSLQAARSGHVAALLADGLVLIAGGSVGGPAANGLELYDSIAGTFTTVSTNGMTVNGHVSGGTDNRYLTDSRFGGTATLLNDGTVLIVAGKDNGGTAVGTAEIYTASYDPQGEISLTSDSGNQNLTPNDTVAGCMLQVNGTGVSACPVAAPATVTPRHANGGTHNINAQFAFADWTTSFNYTQNFLILPLTGNTGGYIFEATNTATSVTEPITWPQSILVGSNTVSDGGVTWLNVGLPNHTASASNTSTPASTEALTVNTLNVTLTAVSDSKTYDGTKTSGQTPTVSVNPLLTSDVAVQTFNVKDVTAHTFNLAVFSGGTDVSTLDYSITPVTGGATATISPKPLSETGLSSPSSKIYDGTVTAAVSGTPTLATAEAPAFGSGGDGAPYNTDVVSITGTSTSTYNFKDVTTATQVTFGGISLTGAQAADYSLTIQTSQPATITAKALTESGLSSPASKIYDATTTAAVNGTANLLTAEAPSFGSGGDGAPYNTDSASITGTATSTYNFKDVTTATQVTFGGIGVTATVPQDYTLTIQAPQPATITAKALTETGLSAPATKTYDATTTAQVSGTATLAAAEAPAFNTGGDGKPYTGDSASITGTATASYNFKDVTTATQVTFGGIGVTANVPQDYTLTIQAAQTATITPKALTETGLSVPASKIYDATTTAVVSGTAALQSAEAPGTGTTADGKPYTGDVASITGTAVGTYNFKDVATATQVSFSGISLTGGQASDYSLTLQASQAATITAKTLTVSGLGASAKIYDATTSATLTGTATLAPAEAAGTGSTADGIQYAGDNITLGGAAVGTFVSKNVGTPVNVTVSGLTLNNNASGDYALSVNQQAGVSANITAKTLTVSGLTANPKTYDTTTNATLGGAASLAAAEAPGSGSTVDGMQYTGDNITLSGTAVGTFVSKNVGTPVNVTVTGLTLANNAAGDYVLPTNQQAGVSANITPATLTYLANTSSRNYGAADPGFSGSVTGFLTGENQGNATTGTLTFTTTALITNNVGNYAINGSGLTANFGNYNFVQAAGNVTAYTINTAPLTVTANALNKTYGQTLTLGAGQTTFTTNPGSLPNGDTIGTVTISSTSGANSATGAAGTYTGDLVPTAPVFASGLSTNYSLSFADGTLTVNQRALNVTATAHSADKTYDATQSAAVTFTNDAVNSDVVHVTSTNLFTDRNVGTNKTVNISGMSIVAGGPAGNYVLGTTPTTSVGNISQKPITVTAAVNTKTYDGGISATAMPTITSGALQGTDTPNFTEAYDNKNAGGGHVLTASGTVNDTNGGNNYAYTFGANTGTINQLPLTVTAVAFTKTYDASTTITGAGSAPTLTSSMGGLAPGDVATGFSEAYSSKDAGIGKAILPSGIAVDGNSGNNYSYTYVNNNSGVINALGIGGTVAVNNKVYDGTNGATVQSCTPVGVLGSDVVTCAAATASFLDKNVANGKTVNVVGVTLAGSNQIDYSISNTTTSTANITARTLTVTATATNKVYDATVIASTNLSDNRIPGDQLTFTSNASFTDKNVGNGKTVNITAITITSGTDQNNYSLSSSSTTATANITPFSLTVTASGSNKVYDGTNAATVTLSDNHIGSDVVTDSSAPPTFPDKMVGVGRVVSVSGISISGADFGNYNLTSTTATTSANITQRPITITAAADTKTYDGSTAAATAPTVTSGSLATGDTAVFTETYSTKTAGPSKMLNPAGVINDGNSGNNYLVTPTSANVGTINPLAIAGSITASNKVYDTTNIATISCAPAGVIPPDQVNCTATSATFSDKNVGNAKTVTASGVSLSGADAGNYSATMTSTTTASITPASLTVSAGGVSKVYDGTNTATVMLTDNHLGTDNVVDNFGTATFSDKNVGTVKQVSVGGISISGGDAPNYTLTNVTAVTSANITPRALVVSATGVNKVFDATTTATVTLSDNRVTGDSLTDSFATAAFAGPNVGTGIGVSVSGVAISGTDANNYSANASAATTAAITPATTTSVVTVPETGNAAEFTFAATVSPQIAGTPTGSVTFMDNGTPLGAGASGSSTVPLTNGAASFTLLVGQLGSGQHNITAVYSKDANFAAATTQVPAGVTVAATLSVSPGAPIAAQNITLSNPTGQSVTYTNLKCSVLSSLGAAVANTLCSVNPASVTVPANGTASIAVDLATNSAATATLRMNGLSTLWMAMPAVVFLPLAAPASIRRRLLRRKLITILGLTLLLAALMFSSGCGGGGFNNPTPLQPGSGTSTTTQPGSYVVQVSGTGANGQVSLASIPMTVGF